ncbi:MAG: FadR family transcriptional regulator [Treponema sp.]|jgi:GntR family transcriptional repressor for pyruvate dehydrogenase complex|nr:FadR family transcriptional regulator [Treponema sp.]
MQDIKKIKAESLRGQVYTALKKKIMQGRWRAGEKLPSEHEFCVMFGVSRVTVRAALQQLAILGLVETKHGGGTFVTEFSCCRNVDALHPLLQPKEGRDLITVMEYRKIIEKGTIGLAREKINREDFIFLEKTYAIMADEARDIAEYIQADLDFHFHLARISRNGMIIKVYELIYEILAAALGDIARLAGRCGSAQHRKMIDALQQGSKAECEALMELHIEGNIEVVRNSGGLAKDTGPLIRG